MLGTNQVADSYEVLRGRDYDWTATDAGGVKNAYIFESDDVDRLMVLPGRRLLGWARQEAAYKATITWLEALQNAGLFPANSKDLCTLTVLAEGSGHNLPMALGVVLDDKFHRGDNWIGVSRFALPEKEGTPFIDFSAKVSYLRIHSNARVWVVLDTIATGATLLKGLDAALSNVEKPERILLGTPCGSHVGMRRIVDWLSERGVEVHPSFWGAAFGLYKDGTGLPWCHPDTVLSGTKRSTTNRETARRLFNDIPGFCAVGDCSANFFDVDDALKVLAEEEERFNWRLPSLDEVEA